MTDIIPGCRKRANVEYFRCPNLSNVQCLNLASVLTRFISS